MTAEDRIDILKFCPSCDRRFGADEYVFACPDDGAALMPVTEDSNVEMVVADKYLIGELIGTGGWSKVYKAHQTQLDRVVAFKLLRADLVASAERIKRFDSEAKLASGLSHPNICTVYDCGILDSGQPYLILEHIQGKSLARVLQDEGAMQAPRAVRLLKQIANALYVAHERSIVHRDLKPGNIMIVGTGADESIKIIDFGLAKAFAAEDREQLTNTGMTIGTPCYMSPEQVRGDALDCRSDIYAFGCLAYEMFTGRKPVQGNSVFETMQGHLHKEPRPMTNARNPVPQPLQDLTMYCLRKRVDERYQTMAEVERSLELYEKVGKVNSPKVRNPAAFNRIREVWEKICLIPRKLKLGRAQTTTIIAALAVPLILLSMTQPGAFNALQPPSAMPKQMDEFTRLRKADNFEAAEPLGKKLFKEMTDKNQQATPEFIDLCTQMRRLLVDHDHHREAIPYIEAMFKVQKKQAAPGSDAEIQAYANASNALLTIDDRDSLPYLEELNRLVSKKYGANSKEFCEPLYHRAWCRFRSGQAEESLKDHLQLIALLPKYYPESALLNVRTLHRTSVVQLHLRKYKDAQETCERAVPLMTAETPGDLQRDLLQAAAHANQHQKNFDKAIALYQRALATSQKVTVTQAEIIMADLGACMVDAGRYKEAEPVLKEAMRLVAIRWGSECDTYQVCLAKYVEMLRATHQDQRAAAIEAAGKV